MYHTRSRLYDRHFCRIPHETDQALAATRNTEIDIAHRRQHSSRSLMRSRQEFDNMWVDPIFLQYFMDDCHLRQVCAVGFLASFQNGSIATLEAEREDIEGDIRPRLEDHTDDTKRHTDAFQMQPVVQCLVFQHTPERRRKGRHMPHVVGNIFQTLRRQEQAVIERIVLASLLQVVSIGLQDLTLMLIDSIGNSVEDLIALVIAEKH